MADLAEALRQHLQTDEEVISSLAERGDQPECVHTIEHHFVARAEAALAPVVELGRRLGFDVAELGGDGDGTYSVNLVSRSTVMRPGIHRESLLMVLVAMAHEVEYDGWGTYVEK